MSKTADQLYLGSLEHIVDKGTVCGNRTDIATRKVFALNERFDLAPRRRFESNIGHGDKPNLDYAFPYLTIRNTAPRIGFWELMWMLNGRTDVQYLQEKDIHIWDGNTSVEYLRKYDKLDRVEPNTIGKGYGYQFRNFNGVDQLKNVYKSLEEDPFGRRHMISLWNPSDLEDMALHPCHHTYTFYAEPCRDANGDEAIGLCLHQQIRSWDMAIGSPYNRYFAVFFLQIMAKALGYVPLSYAVTAVDAHIYENHMNAVNKMMEVKDIERFKNQINAIFLRLREIEGFEDMLSLTEDDYEIYSGGFGGKLPDPLLRFNKKDLAMAV